MTTIPPQRPSVRSLLLGGVALALAVRAAILLWASARGLVIDNEGVEYCRIAENLLAGRGFVGIFANGPQLNFPPLYPWLIAVVSLVLPSTELAARVVNVVLGAALVIPMFRIADRLYGRRTALIAAVLAVVHPLLVLRSVSTYVEGAYLTFLLFGLDYALTWLDERRWRDAVATGLFLGLGYLMRPEAFLLVGVLGACGFGWWVLRRERATLIAVAGLVGVFLLVASPYVVYLTAHTGQVRFEAKGALAYAWGQRMRSGMSYLESVHGIGEDLSPQGVFMRPNRDVLRSASPSTMEMARYVAATAPRNVKTIAQTLTTSQSIGSPILVFLVILGLLRSPWDRRRLVREGLLVTSGAVTVLALASVQDFWFRYYYSFMGLMLVWGAKGADELGDWGERTVTALGGAGVRAGRVLAVAAAAAVCLVALRALPRESEFVESRQLQARAAGVWLAAHAPGPKWIMGTSLLPAYYAGGDMKYLPYGGSELALRYVALEQPDFIILMERAKTELAYYAQWFDAGIPDPRAQLVYDEGTPPQERIKIYRWVRAVAPRPSAR